MRRDADKKYYGVIPDIKRVRLDILRRRDANEMHPDHYLRKGSGGEVGYRFAQKWVARYEPLLKIPIEVSVFADGEVVIYDGHHRVATARALGKKTLPAIVKAINARGSTLNALARHQLKPKRVGGWSEHHGVLEHLMRTYLFLLHE